MERNRSENRLLHKPSKRDIATSEARLIMDDECNRYVSNDGEIPFENYLKIDNSSISAEEVAKRIQEHFNL